MQTEAQQQHVAALTPGAGHSVHPHFSPAAEGLEAEVQEGGFNLLLIQLAGLFPTEPVGGHR